MKKRRFLSIAILLSIFFFSVPIFIYSQKSSFKKKDLYIAMSISNSYVVDSIITVLKSNAIKEKMAYEGALMMKKASLTKGVAKKLKLFKEGHQKLEAAITKNKENAEFRFLRLIIQENAPGILNYKNDLEKDGAYIRQSYKKLPAEVQQAIANYSKTSKVLRPEDF